MTIEVTVHDVHVHVPAGTEVTLPVAAEPQDNLAELVVGPRFVLLDRGFRVNADHVVVIEPAAESFGCILLMTTGHKVKSDLTADDVVSRLEGAPF